MLQAHGKATQKPLRENTIYWDSDIFPHRASKILQNIKHDQLEMELKKEKKCSTLIVTALVDVGTI